LERCSPPKEAIGTRSQSHANPLHNPGQPFDIVKVRLQTTNEYRGALDCATRILKHEGAAAFYKGTLTPLIGIGACVSVQFGAFNYAKRAFESSNNANNNNSTLTQNNLSYTQYYLSGAFAGLANTLLSTPIEHIRIRMQTQPHGAARLYSGPLDCIRKLSRSPSITHGLYRGTAVTCLREAQAYGFWFLTFEYLMAGDIARNRLASRGEVPTWKVALYGGLAGEMLWIASYPFDVIKSKMQTDGFGAEQRYRSMRDAFGQVWRTEGMAGFWRGVGPTLARALPVSSGTFVTVEMVLRMIS
jgi:solute carrier family 25 carnitine/acylcarnitine transporter 20/29